MKFEYSVKFAITISSDGLNSVVVKFSPMGSISK